MMLVGSVMFLGSCCVWSLGGGGQWPDVPPPETWSDLFADQRLPAALGLASLLVTLLGGLSVFGAGVGLYGERPSAGPLGWIAVLLSAICFAAIAGLQLWRLGSWRGAILPGAFAVLMTILLPLAYRAAGVMHAHPPPPDQNRVTDDWLKEDARQRRRRRDEV